VAEIGLSEVVSIEASPDHQQEYARRAVDRGVQLDPQAYLAQTLTAIVQGHKQNRIDELLPWNYAP
jgi:hypothetical protein